MAMTVFQWFIKQHKVVVTVEYLSCVDDFVFQLSLKPRKLHDLQHLDQSEALLDLESPSSLIGQTDIKVTCF